MHKGMLTIYYEAIQSAKGELSGRIDAWSKLLDTAEEAELRREVISRAMKFGRGLNPKILSQLVNMEINGQC